VIVSLGQGASLSLRLVSIREHLESLESLAILCRVRFAGAAGCGRTIIGGDMTTAASFAIPSDMTGDEWG
jgi:hypothetical protein